MTTAPASSTQSADTAPTLQARGVTKRFGHVEALRRVGFDAHAGEITALIGATGAGASRPTR